jgi:hypothetical protein
MEKEPNKFSRDDIRILAQSINKLLGNIETKDLTDEQLTRCYEAAWSTKEIFAAKASDLPNDKLKEALKKGIEKNYTRLGEVIQGTQDAGEFAEFVAEAIA